MSTIERVLLRCIFNSCAGLSVEAEVVLHDGSHGSASTPVAIKAGEREKPTSLLIKPGRIDADPAIQALLVSLQATPFNNQAHFDRYLAGQLYHTIGADVTLALSLAFARAMAASMSISFVQYINSLTTFLPRMPHPLVNIFSGGIHGNPDSLPFQQIMIIPCYETFYEDVDVALRIYTAIEQKMLQRSLLVGYSASSGMLVKALDYYVLLEEITEHITRLGCSSSVFLGVDIAAEHFKQVDGSYRFAGTSVEGVDLIQVYEQLATRFNIKYLEDPFYPSDTELWQQLHALLGDRTLIVGDDLFATDVHYILPDVGATGILLKMNQAGTLTATLEAALEARTYDMSLCLSHRSCETEDTAMCDLAVAIGADFIKIGGPRRGDRIAKYNQLLRLAEDVQSFPTKS